MSTTKQRLSSDAPIQAEPEHRLDWSKILTVFLRTLAILSLVRGLSNWATICGIWSGGDTRGFEDLAPSHQATIVFFAVIELVAGIGLWLTSAWGGVVWLLAALVALVIDASAWFGMPGWVNIAARPHLATLADLTLMAFYLFAASAAARQSDGPDEE